MPFGALFGAIVFGILGPWRGIRLMGSAMPLPYKVMGACIALLGLSIAAGLLAKRPWARWFGVVCGLWLALSALKAFVSGGGGTLDLLVILASFATSVLLVVPMTGRPDRPAEGTALPRPWPGRAFLATACLAIVGFLGATAWAVASAPMPVAHKKDAKGAKGAEETGAVWSDFASGISAAKSSRKLMVVDFYATWCNPCKFMEKKTFRDARVMARLKDVVPVRVDSEEEVERGGLKGVDLALRYGIEVYPTIVAIDGEGHEVARNTGAMGADEFLAWLDAVLERAGTSVAKGGSAGA